jgi:hypothetical protein
MSKEVTRRLGRGLSSLISVPDFAPTEGAAVADPAQMHPPGPPLVARVDQLRPNALQPRKDMDPAELKALAESIRATGILQPIVVRPREAEVVVRAVCLALMLSFVRATGGLPASVFAQSTGRQAASGTRVRSRKYETLH